jgi:hypothetical protein
MPLYFFGGGSSPGSFRFPPGGEPWRFPGDQGFQSDLDYRVFSLMPVNSAALASNSSSMFRVVLMPSPLNQMYKGYVMICIYNMLCQGLYE